MRILESETCGCLFYRGDGTCLEDEKFAEGYVKVCNALLKAAHYVVMGK